MLELKVDFFSERFFYFFCARPFEIDRVGKIILYRLQLYRVERVGEAEGAC